MNSSVFYRFSPNFRLSFNSACYWRVSQAKVWEDSVAWVMNIKMPWPTTGRFIASGACWRQVKNIWGTFLEPLLPPSFRLGRMFVCGGGHMCWGKVGPSLGHEACTAWPEVLPRRTEDGLWIGASGVKFPYCLEKLGISAGYKLGPHWKSGCLSSKLSAATAFAVMRIQCQSCLKVLLLAVGRFLESAYWSFLWLN